MRPEVKSQANCISEQEIIHGAKRGDSTCFESLYNTHKRRVYAVCFRFTRNSAEAEDLTQEVFLHLFCSLAKFRGDAALATCLYRVTVNGTLMHRRRKSLPIAPDPLELQTAGAINTEDESLARIALERSVERLPPGYRVVFLLHEVEGYEHNEIAKMIACSVGNSKSQLHHARLQLRSRLQIESGARPALAAKNADP